MFNKSLFILVALCVGCGEEVVVEKSLDFSSDASICIDEVEVTYKEGMNISSVDINKEYLIVEEYINKYIDKYYPAAGHVDVLDMFTHHPISVHYVYELDNRGEFHMSTNDIVLRYPAANGSDIDACVEKYYLLGHELMHYVAKYHLGVSDSDNALHNVPHIFFYNAPIEDRDNAEWYVYMDTYSVCVMEING